MGRARKGLPIRNLRNWSKHLLKSLAGASGRRFHRLAAREKGKRVMGGRTKESDKRVLAILKGFERAKTQKKSNRSGGLSMFEAGLSSKIIADTTLKNLQLKKKISAKEYPHLYKATIKLVKAITIKPFESEQLAKEAGKEITRICGAKMGDRIIQEITGMMRIMKDWIFE